MHGSTSRLVELCNAEEESSGVDPSRRLPPHALSVSVKCSTSLEGRRADRRSYAPTGRSCDSF
jgi:hypothetical protein